MARARGKGASAAAAGASPKAKRSSAPKEKAKGRKAVAKAKGKQALGHASADACDSPLRTSGCKRTLVDIDADTPEKGRDRARKVQIARLKEKNLGYVDPLILRTRRDPQGRGIDERLEDEIKLLPKAMSGRPKVYLSVNFWQTLADDFQFKVQAFQQLPPLPQGAKVSEELVEALTPAMVKSLPERDTEPFEYYLESSVALTATDLHAAIIASMEGPRVMKHQSDTMMKAVMKHMGKHGLDKKCGELWLPMNESCESLAVNDFDNNVAKGFGRSEWLATNVDMVKLFVDADLCIEADAQIAVAKQKLAEESDVSGEDADDRDCADGAPTKHLGKFISSQLGRELFRDEAKDYHFRVYRDAADKAIQDLMYSEWPEDQVLRYATDRKDDIKNLKLLGVKVVGRSRAPFPCYGAAVLARFSTTLLDSEQRLKNGGKRHAASTLDLERLPWEVILFGKEAPIPGERAAGKVPDWLLKDARTSRRALNAKWGANAQTWTLEKMQEEVAKDVPTMCKFEKGFAVDAKFLLDHALPMAANMITDDLLAAIPSKTEAVPDLNAAISRVREICKSLLVSRSSRNLRNDAEVILDCLLQLRKTDGPAAKAGSQSSKMFIAALGKMENFLKYETTVKTVHGKVVMFPAKVILTGRDAVEQITSDWAVFKADKLVQNNKSLEMIRKFRWLFSDALHAETSLYLDEARTAVATDYEARSIEDALVPLKDEEKGIVAPFKEKRSRLSIASSAMSSKDVPGAVKVPSKLAESRTHLFDLFESSY